MTLYRNSGNSIKVLRLVGTKVSERREFYVNCYCGVLCHGELQIISFIVTKHDSKPEVGSPPSFELRTLSDTRSKHTSNFKTHKTNNLIFNV